MKRMFAFLAILASLFVGSAVAAAPASADVVWGVNLETGERMAMRSYATCPSGQSCLYTGQNGAGTQRALAFSQWGPPGTCRNINFYPVGGYHSAKGGYGSGYALAVYGALDCNNWWATLYNGQTVSNAFGQIRSVLIT